MTSSTDSKVTTTWLWEWKKGWSPLGWCSRHVLNVPRTLKLLNFSRLLPGVFSVKKNCLVDAGVNCFTLMGLSYIHSLQRTRFPGNSTKHESSPKVTGLVKGPVIRAIFSCNLSRNNVAVASWNCLLRVLPPSRTTSFYVAESKRDIYFLQHENLLREKVVIRATNNFNLQRQHFCATSCTKMLPVLLRLKGKNT